MKSLIKEYNLDGIAVRCWPELPNSKELGSWCYLALARLASEGKYRICANKGHSCIIAAPKKLSKISAFY